jgi:hypothetical protein
MHKEVFLMSLSGDSSLEGEVEAGDTSFNVSGASRATLTGSGQNLTVAAADGNSTVFYLGSPTLGTINSTGSSEVRPK